MIYDNECIVADCLRFEWKYVSFAWISYHISTFDYYFNYRNRMWGVNNKIESIFFYHEQRGRQIKLQHYKCYTKITTSISELLVTPWLCKQYYVHWMCFDGMLCIFWLERESIGEPPSGLAYTFLHWCWNVKSDPITCTRLSLGSLLCSRTTSNAILHRVRHLMMIQEWTDNVGQSWRHCCYVKHYKCSLLN